LHHVAHLSSLVPCRPPRSGCCCFAFLQQTVCVSSVNTHIQHVLYTPKSLPDPCEPNCVRLPVPPRAALALWHDRLRCLVFLTQRPRIRVPQSRYVHPFFSLGHVPYLRPTRSGRSLRCFHANLRTPPPHPLLKLQHILSGPPSSGLPSN